MQLCINVVRLCAKSISDIQFQGIINQRFLQFICYIACELWFKLQYLSCVSSVHALCRMLCLLVSFTFTLLCSTTVIFSFFFIYIYIYIQVKIDILLIQFVYKEVQILGVNQGKQNSNCAGANYNKTKTSAAN